MKIKRDIKHWLQRQTRGWSDDETYNLNYEFIGWINTRFRKYKELVIKEIITNKIKCNYCNDIIESKSVHDYKICKCGEVSVDGGHDYLSRSFPDEIPFNPNKHFTDLSHYITNEGEEINNDKCI